ncbi:hypothetical protein BABINDRAFT_162388 [Babjeviella inositovora NRRL Y-12698]|uniref:Uncharacterized protein n=1 Tax=Babjeviella inositovora NRRL Y-12698 TaxID=984486 RepID=A0A1E3QLX2_9ASCO|nr:uncharacterized protein BABINDRAFT_162388 [Babjeviella inositovora NRRL Y-12698]ODQ78685.1 hypothetical protein BABINDRAFT_162388 [Babjeviella inositovora NRRL Y-12698]
MQDSNDYLTDTIGFGYTKRRVLNHKILDGSLTFRDGFREMLASIHAPFDECIEILLKNIKLDPGFRVAYNYCTANNIPVIVVSSGMKPIIHALLLNLVGEDAAKNIEIISNEVEIKEDKTWDIVYIDESDFGHDKSRAIKPYSQKRNAANPVTQKALSEQVLFYCGDGVSDLSAARETDLLFAKRGMDLVTYCEAQNVPYKNFDDWSDILQGIKDVIEGGKNVKDLIENKGL